MGLGTTLPTPLQLPVTPTKTTWVLVGGSTTASTTSHITLAVQGPGNPPIYLALRSNYWLLSKPSEGPTIGPQDTLTLQPV